MGGGAAVKAFGDHGVGRAEFLLEHARPAVGRREAPELRPARHGDGAPGVGIAVANDRRHFRGLSPWHAPESAAADFSPRAPGGGSPRRAQAVLVDAVAEARPDVPLDGEAGRAERLRRGVERHHRDQRVGVAMDEEDRRSLCDIGVRGAPAPASRPE